MHPPLRHTLSPDPIPRHLHTTPYVAVVLEGGYEEAGERGRFRVEAGDVLVHAPFSAHWNPTHKRAGRPAVVLNLPLTAVPTFAAARIADPDALVRLAERDPLAATDWLTTHWTPGRAALDDAPDLMAAALSDLPDLGVEAWAREHGVTRETAFRWFRQTYGVGPARYRVEARARRAWGLITGTTDALAAIAAEAGFADQAHMTRDVKALTGRAPGQWRVAA